MKPLIAFTCVAVLAALGYVGWGEITRAQEREQRAEWQTMRSACVNQVKYYTTLDSRSEQGEAVEAVIRTCHEKGYLSAADLAR